MIIFLVADGCVCRMDVVDTFDAGQGSPLLREPGSLVCGGERVVHENAPFLFRHERT
jgi:hypothetical protein